MNSNLKIYDGSIWKDTWTCFPDAQVILRRVLPRRQWNVLILGCGDGKHTLPFLVAGHKVQALDDDPVVQTGGSFTFLGETLIMRPLLENVAREGLPLELVSLKQVDYMHYDSPDLFDVVLTSCSWQFRRNWVYPIRSILQKIKSFIAPGGLLVADYMQPHGEKYLNVEHYLTPARMAEQFDESWHFHLHRDDGVIRERHINGENWHEHRYCSLVVQRISQ